MTSRLIQSLTEYTTGGRPITVRQAYEIIPLLRELEILRDENRKLKERAK